MNKAKEIVEQEPVAWVAGYKNSNCVIVPVDGATVFPTGLALYTAPPKREQIDLRKAAEMALDKLEHLWDIGIDAEYKVELLPEIKALRQALAQYEQEPANKMPTKIFGPSLEQILNAAGFYKHEWVGLTTEEISEAYNANYDNYYNDVDIVDCITIVRAVEAKLKEKNERPPASI